MEPVEQEAKDHLEELDGKFEDIHSYIEDLNQIKSEENLSECELQDKVEQLSHQYEADKEKIQTGLVEFHDKYADLDRLDLDEIANEYQVALSSVDEEFNNALNK